MLLWLVVIASLIGLMIIHEFGHFVIAKKFGVKVEEFGVGYPPRIFGKKFGETIYSLNLLPFGAFVRIHGEIGGAEEYRSFMGKPIWQRVLIILGGVASFWVVSAVLFSIVMGLGAPVAIGDDINGNLTDPKVQIISVAKGSPAEAAGLKIGDAIKQFSVAGSQFQINKTKEVIGLTEEYKGEKITLTIERGKDIFEVSLVPRISPPEGEGAMGVALVRTAKKSYPWHLAPLKGMETSLVLTGAIVAGLFQTIANLFTGAGLPPGVQLTGPVGIGGMMVQAAQLGIDHYIQFVGLIALYLAIFNVLPVPALDGGKLLFLGIEAFRRKPVPQKTEKIITAFFFSLLIALMVWVTIKDITRFF
jgi:regulator of sigma E protease